MLAPMLAVLLAAAAPAPITAGALFPTLQGGETLGVGGSRATVAAGYSTFSVAYAQGFASDADVGFQLEADWVTSELFLGGLYRQALTRVGDVFIAWRARAGAYADLGTTWATSPNQSDGGIQLVPGLALSRSFSRGVVSLAADVPIDVTFSRGGGLMAGVRGTVAFETPLWADVLVGARFGGGVLGSTSAAPFGGDSPRALVELSLLLTYRLL